MALERGRLLGERRGGRGMERRCQGLLLYSREGEERGRVAQLQWPLMAALTRGPGRRSCVDKSEAWCEAVECAPGEPQGALLKIEGGGGVVMLLQSAGEEGPPH